MGAVAAVRILHRRKLAAVAEDLRPTMELELAAEHEKIAGGVDKAVEIGVVDEVVDPTVTRTTLCAALAALDSGSRGQHGNIPL
jgi:acetyl-CoA/propionyl-CoA carboxylase carboxyl transferase subunit